MSESGLYVGALSGTSMDGIDVVICKLNTQMASRPSIIHARTHTLNFALRQRLSVILGKAGDTTLDDCMRMDQDLGSAFADAINRSIKQAGLNAADISAIGSHGQTIAHQLDARHRYTVQIANPNIISERCGIVTVSDFRRRDMAAGGEGAPLAPALHRLLFHSDTENRVIVNIGGIANITCLPACESAGEDLITGYDCGPGNCLMDAWIDDQQGLALDRHGEWASGGDLQQALLSRMLADPYLMRPAPKSIGREYFDLAWLSKQFAGRVYRPIDVQATLCQLTAESISQAIEHSQPNSARVMVCGGGVHNLDMMKRLKHLLPHAVIESTSRTGIDPNWVEGILFAWLAARRLEGLPGNCPSVTEANGKRVLGAVYSA